MDSSNMCKVICVYLLRETIYILIISQAYLIKFVGEMVKNIIKKKKIRILYGKV